MGATKAVFSGESMSLCPVVHSSGLRQQGYLLGLGMRHGMIIQKFGISIPLG
jgi:hypothetical protein